MRALALLAAIGLGGCLDYNFKGNRDDPDAGDDTAPDDGVGDDTGPPEDPACPPWDFPVAEVGVTDACEVPAGSFTPIVEWDLMTGKHSRATVAVGDLNKDGMPEIVANIMPWFGQGTLVVAEGDGSGVLWDLDLNLGYAAAPAIGDVDGDGWADIVVVKEYDSSMAFGVGDYTLVAVTGEGEVMWESEHFVGDDFDYASAIHLSDMDHDGSVEVVAGRVILNADGSTRGVGAYGRGCFGTVAIGGITPDEAAISAVADLDLDGTEEVIVGNAMYNPDGVAIWHDASVNDGLIAIANLDSDPEGEFVAVTGNTVRGVDTDGSILWGPVELPTANIVSPPAIDDIDGDGWPEVVVAGGNTLKALNHDGSVLWSVKATDMTGASGASIFDFEGDGQPEVVYIDEVEMAAFDGLTGALKFYSTDHSSDTMYDYPVIADVDADDQAEIVVAHVGQAAAISIYGDQDQSWVPARQVWNQHGYSISNINDDLSVPTTATPNFTTFNSWHSALDGTERSGVITDVEGEILDVCDLDCDEGVLRVAARLLNRSDAAVPAGVPVALFAVVGGSRVLADVAETSAETPSGMSSEVLDFEVDATLAQKATALWLSADNDGTGNGVIDECVNDNNDVTWTDASCP